MITDLRVPAADELLRAWERGRIDDAVRAEALLDALGVAPGAADALPLGRRNRLLLAARAGLFGVDADVEAPCARCGLRLEARLDLGAIFGGPPEGTHQTADDAVLRVQVRRYDVRLRLPTGADLRDLPAEVEAAAQELLARCVLAARRADRRVAPARLPSSVVTSLETALADADPDAVIEVVLVCPDCDVKQPTPLDPVAFLWFEVDAWAWRLLDEVRSLAAAYGWSESDILRMTPARRQAYLHLGGAFGVSA